MSDACPSFSEIRRLGELTGDAEPDPEVAAHLDACQACRTLLDRLMIEGTGSGASTILTTIEESTADPDAPPAIPGLVDFQKIGQGGSAVVYKARREGLDAWVAVKFLDPGPPGSRSRRERAVREAQAAARVRHSNVVRTIDVGLAGGVPYIVMEYFEAGTLADRLGKSGVLPPREAARLVLALAEAVQAIHDRGLIHRDLKPSNVLLHGKADADLVDLNPIVADFGLAREIEAEGHTDTRHGPGTPGYMAPEQVEGRTGTNSGAVDIFALGAVLFRLLTGRPPFSGKSRVETMRLTVEGKAPAASRYAPGIPARLEAILAACLRRRPADRYPSAAALAEDLRRFLEGRRPIGRPRGVASRVWALLAAGAFATALAAPSLDFSSDRVSTPAAVPSSPVVSDDAALKERVDAAARLIGGLIHRTNAMNVREVDDVVEASENALAEGRSASPRLIGDPEFRRDYADLAGNVATFEGRRGNHAVACDLYAEAAEFWRPIAGASWTTEARLRCSWALIAVSRKLTAMKRFDEAIAAITEEREVLRPILDDVQGKDADREARYLLATIQIDEGPAAVGWRSLASLREELRDDIRDRPEAVHLWQVLGDICTLEGRHEEAVEACRRRMALPRREWDLGVATANYLASSLINLARVTRDPLQRQSALAEADDLVRDSLARVGRIKSYRGDEFSVVEDASWLETLTRALKEEHERDAAASAGDRFADRLAAALGAETCGGTDAVDGGQLASVHELLAGEYAWLSRPGVSAASSPGAVRGGISSDIGLRDMERGLALLEGGEASTARVRFATALVVAAGVHRIIDGDWSHAADLCDQSRTLIEATPDAGPPADRLAVLNLCWLQKVKALWDHADRPRTREALHRSVESARAWHELVPDRLEARLTYDKAITRLAHFECEGGEYDTAATVMASRRALWTPGSVEAVAVEDAIRAIENERNGRRLVAEPGPSPVASPAR